MKLFWAQAQLTDSLTAQRSGRCSSAPNAQTPPEQRTCHLSSHWWTRRCSASGCRRLGQYWQDPAGDQTICCTGWAKGNSLSLSRALQVWGLPPTAGTAQICPLAHRKGPEGPPTLLLSPITHLVQKPKFGIIFLWVFTAWVWMLLHQEHVSFFTLKQRRFNYTG